MIYVDSLISQWLFFTNIRLISQHSLLLKTHQTAHVYTNSSLLRSSKANSKGACSSVTKIKAPSELALFDLKSDESLFTSFTNIYVMRVRIESRIHWLPLLWRATRLFYSKTTITFLKNIRIVHFRPFTKKISFHKTTLPC